MRTLSRTLASTMVMSVLAIASASGQERPGHETAREVTVTADVIDLSCKLVHDLSGTDHRMCAQVCAENGIPLALFVDGEVYMPVSMGMPGTGANEQLKPFAEQRVRVSGKVIDRGGIKSILIENVQRA